MSVDSCGRSRDLGDANIVGGGLDQSRAGQSRTDVEDSGQASLLGGFSLAREHEGYTAGVPMPMVAS